MEARMHGTMHMVAQCSAKANKRQFISPIARPSPRDALDLLEQIGITFTAHRDRQIYGQGDVVQFCYKILGGCVRRVKLTEDGRRQVGEFLLPGDLFGFDDLDTHDFAAEAVSDVVLRRYSRRMVEALADGQLALARRLRDLTSIRLRTAHSRLMLLGRTSASERIASFLLEMAERLPERDDCTVNLPMTRTDMADHLGLTIETVCRIFAHLRRDGTITVERGGIKIPDRVSLEMMALEPRH
jgi:CRP/FNR family transcriptional regulator, nitrogen fixation regulation protein